MNIIKRYWRIVFPALFAIVIWAFSSANGAASQETSQWVSSIFGIPNPLMRKLAHFGLFAGFGFSISSFFKGLEPNAFPNLTSTIYAIVIPVAYAAIDEVHQLAIAGRNGSVADVFLDALAGVFGVCAYIAIFCFFHQSQIKELLRRKNKIWH